MVQIEWHFNIFGNDVGIGRTGTKRSATLQWRCRDGTSIRHRPPAEPPAQDFGVRGIGRVSVTVPRGAPAWARLNDLPL